MNDGRWSALLSTGARNSAATRENQKREKKMRRYSILPIALAVLSTVLSTASAQDAVTPVAIPILNPKFVVDTLQCAAGASCYQLGITGWLDGPSTALFKAGTAQFPGAPPGGLYVAAIGNVNVQATGSILQTLGATLKANTTYTLKVTVGARLDYPFKGCVAALVAGNVTLASGNSPTPAPAPL